MLFQLSFIPVSFQGIEELTDVEEERKNNNTFYY